MKALPPLVALSAVLAATSTVAYAKLHRAGPIRRATIDPLPSHHGSSTAHELADPAAPVTPASSGPAGTSPGGRGSRAA